MAKVSKRVLMRGFSVACVAVLCVAAALLTSCGSSGSSGGEQVKPPVSSSSAEGKSYEDIVLQFEKAGFTNVTSEGLGDLITGWINKENSVKEVSVDGKTNYSTGTGYPPDAKVVVRYHSFPERSSSSSASSSSREEGSSESGSSSSDSSSSSTSSSAVEETGEEAALEQAFPVETARKAAVVALTNATASDVFASDGNSHDVSRYHRYSDRSGDYLELVGDGTWTAKGASTWHVEGMELVNSFGTEMTASLDVSYDGTNYVVSNLSGVLGKPGVGTSLDQLEKYYDPTWTYLTVTPDLLD